MRRVLSIDLACKRAKDFGICLIEIAHATSPYARFPPAIDLGFTDPPSAEEYAKAIFKYCREQEAPVVLLDGPQGWKDPKNPLKHARCCERILNAPAKAGTEGNVKPRNYTRFVSFSINLFSELEAFGARLLTQPEAVPKSGELLVLESLPLSAWKKLCIDPLPAKKRATTDDIKNRFDLLRTRFRIRSADIPNHDQLQAMVSGLAGIAILKRDPDHYVAEGLPPKKVRGVTVQGYIINPHR